MFKVSNAVVDTDTSSNDPTYPRGEPPAALPPSQTLNKADRRPRAAAAQSVLCDDGDVIMPHHRRIYKNTYENLIPVPATFDRKVVSVLKDFYFSQVKQKCRGYLANMARRCFRMCDKRYRYQPLRTVPSGRTVWRKDQDLLVGILFGSDVRIRIAYTGPDPRNSNHTGMDPDPSLIFGPKAGKQFFAQ